MTPVVAAKKLSNFDPKTFLATISGGRKIEAFPKKQTIFVQGDSPEESQQDSHHRKQRMATKRRASRRIAILL